MSPAAPEKGDFWTYNMRVPNTPSFPSRSQSPAMDNRSSPEMKTERDHHSYVERLFDKWYSSPEETLRLLGYPISTAKAIDRINLREALDFDDVEEFALAINDPRSPIDGFLFTPRLLHTLGDDPRAVWYGRHTLFLVGEIASYSLLHWDRNYPHYIAHYDPQGLDGFICPVVVQSLVKATFHQQGCPDLPIKSMECPRSDRIESGFYSLYFAQALLMGKPIPDQPLPEPFVQMIRDFHLNPAPLTSNIVPMRPIRRTATGPLEWWMPDAKMSSASSTASDRVEDVVNPYQGTIPSPSPTPSARASSTSSTEPCPWKEPCFVASYPEQSVDSGQGTMSSLIPVLQGDSSCVPSSGRVLLPASLSGQKSPFPRACLPFRSAPTNAGAFPETSSTNGPSAKGKEPATASTNGSSVQQKEAEASITIGPSAKRRECQVRLYEEVKAEIQDTNLALLKANFELRVVSAAVLIARCRLGRKEFSVSDFKRGMDACIFTKVELTKACDQIPIFISPALRESIINGDLRFEQSDMGGFTRDSHDDLLSPARFTETKRLEEELRVKKEAQQEAANGYTKARMKKVFLDDAWSGALWKPMTETLMKNLEDLFGSRDFLSYVKGHDYHGRAGDNDK